MDFFLQTNLSLGKKRNKNTGIYTKNRNSSTPEIEYKATKKKDFLFSFLITVERQTMISK
jgi:hypothetical protein